MCMKKMMHKMCFLTWTCNICNKAGTLRNVTCSDSQWTKTELSPPEALQERSVKLFFLWIYITSSKLRIFVTISVTLTQPIFKVTANSEKVTVMFLHNLAHTAAHLNAESFWW